MNVNVDKLCVTVEGKGKPKVPKALLTDVTFKIESGDVVALMGPSGAGKTTLLNRLVGRGITGEVTGSITYSGQPLQNARSGIGYVTQDDIMYETLTPRENLSFAASFLQGHASAAQKKEAVEAVLRKLRLVKCADTVVGIPGLVKGISGGERKRTNVALSLLSNPHLLLLDEPTSGLDSKMADELMTDVSDVAKNGCTAVATIHQPSEAVFSRFKKVLLLESGHIAYYGQVQGLRDMLSQIGFQMSSGMVPLPEILLDILEAPKDVAADVHSKRLADLKTRSIKPNANDGSPVGKIEVADRLNFPRQLALLFKRNFLAFRRNKILTVVRTMQSIMSSVLIGWIFVQVDKDLDGVNVRVFGAFLLAFAQFLFAILGVVNTFPQEKAVFLREAQDRWYHPAAFYLAKVLLDTILQCFFPIIVTCIGYFMIGLNTDKAERVFIFYLFLALLSNCGAAIGFIVSAAVSSVSTALSIVPGLVMPQLVLSGLFIPVKDMPQPFNALSHVVLARYALQGVITNEFICETDAKCTAAYHMVSGGCDDSPCDFCCTSEQFASAGGLCPIVTCDQALVRANLDADSIWPSGDENIDTVWYNMLCMVVLLIFFRCVGLFSLLMSYRRASKSG
mmetsp:Transcript_40268/g.86414  ORF Transcript_40268/g.86414 Transcript_40268/m.86414 type:complete len:622 (-) Transcript_40268:260-2125(-)